MLDNAYELLNNKYKDQLNLIENFEIQNNDIFKKFKNLQFEHNNNNDLVVKLLKTKLNGIRSEINSTKLYYTNEIKNIKKEHSKMIESLSDKIKIFSVGFEKDKVNLIKNARETMEKELKIKLSEKEKELQNEIIKITHKYENTLTDQLKLLEKKDIENKNLVT